MFDHIHPLLACTRRQLFQDCGIGLGKIALTSLMTGGLQNMITSQTHAHEPASSGYLLPNGGKAKRVIYLFMAGAPSQLDLFDYKPELTRHEGKPLPKSVTEGQRLAFIQPDAAVLGPRFEFAKHGQSGAEISSALPHLSKVADDIAFIKTVHTDHFNHAPAQLFVNTGNGVPGRPSMGSWVTYGIGSEATDLPGFVVLTSGATLSGGTAMWGSGLLPSSFQGVPFRNSGDPILNVTTPKGMDQKSQRDALDAIKSLNQQRLSRQGDPETATRIAAYEMAYRMQTRVPELMDTGGVTKETLDLYGAEPGNAKKAFANNCLLAKRLAERGVRFIQVYHSDWDHHSDVAGGLKNQCGTTDQPCAALLTDLKRSGMLDDTLVIWGGEFGRTPMVESSVVLGRSQGRDHHPQAYTMWMAGGGIKPGITVGKTDDLGFKPVEDPVHVHDLQATVLHCLGIDHAKLSSRSGGLNVRLTGVEEHHVVEKLLA